MFEKTGPYKLRCNGKFVQDPDGNVYRCTGYDHALNLAMFYAHTHSVYIFDCPTSTLVRTVRPEDLPDEVHHASN